MLSWEKIDAIPGWFMFQSYCVWRALLDQQARIPGDLFEIGVWRGRSASVLASYRKSDEKLYLCDLRLEEEAVHRAIRSVGAEPVNIVPLSGPSADLPAKLDLKAMLKFAPEGITRPRWLLEFARSGKLPDLTAPNLATPGEDPPTFFGAYGEWMGTPLPTWDDVKWLRDEWGGPFMVKGIMHPDDARRAVDIGATAISVSNHGGNNLDGTPASIRALPAVVDAVGDQVEVLLDGGIRRGSDVVKALALGARAVLIGRAYLWGMAAAGERGVSNVLEILRSGIDEALLGLGRSSIHDLTREDLIIPDGFTKAAPVARPVDGLS